MRLTFAALALAPLAAGMAQAAADPARYMPAELIAQSAAPKPGTTILVGFRMTPRPGWHGYWSNPGDSGIAPSVQWTAPAGVRFGPLLHPAPTLIEAGGISSFVHEGPHILLTRMTVDRSVAPGTPIPIEARLDWGACTATQCVPLHATLTLDLTAGAGAASADAAALTAAEHKIPEPAANGAFTLDGKTIRLIAPTSVRLDPAHTRFFPDRNDAFAAARGRAAKDDGQIAITGPAIGAPPRSITGVVTDGRSSYRIAFERDAGVEQAQSAAPAEAPVAVKPQQGEVETIPAVQPESGNQARADATASAVDWRWFGAAALATLIAAAVAWRRMRRA